MPNCGFDVLKRGFCVNIYQNFAKNLLNPLIN